jgi:LmbE family N-acetylglucosaminyl deacetylase
MVTDGAAGSNEPDIDVKELAQRRQVEQCAAAEKVGVHDVRFLGYSDGTLQPTLEVRRDLTRLIREVKPDTVVCQDPTTVFVESSYINHPDHRAAGEAAVYAAFPSAETRPIFPELLAEGYEPHHVKHLVMTLTLNPNGFVDIAETIEQKIEALLCHKSQVDETVGNMVREWSIENGREVGAPHAERLRIMHFDDKPDEESA